MSAQDYTCEACGGSFTDPRDPDAARTENLAELASYAPGTLPGDYALVCHNCWLGIMERAEAAGYPVPPGWEA